MKRWFIGIGVLAFLLVGGYFALTFYAVRFIQPYVQMARTHGMTFAEARIRVTHLAVTGVQYEDPRLKQRVFLADEVRIYPSLLSLLTSSFRIKEITIPEATFYLYRSREGSLVGLLAMPAEQAGEARAFEKGDGRAVQVEIGRIRIEKGSVHFEDQEAAQPASQIKLKDFDLEVRDIRYPLTSLPSPVALNGKLVGPTREGSVHLTGWIDSRTMNLEISLKMKNIEIKIFEPYYRKRVTAGIMSGAMNMESKIAVKEKKIDAPGEMELIDLRLENKGAVFRIPTDTLVPLLEKKGNRIKATFHVKGDMKNPRFDLKETFLTQVAFSLVQGLGFPVKVIGEEPSR